MALQKQNVSFNFTKGVDTKTDPYQVQGKLLTLENGVFQTSGAVRKRNGYAEIGLNGLVPQGNAIAGFNNEVTVLDGAHLYSYAQESDAFVQKGNKVAVDIVKNSIVKNNYTQAYASCAYHSSGLKFFTWYDSAGGSSSVYYSIVDSQTGNHIKVSQSLISGVTSIATLTVGNYFVFIYAVNGTSNLNYISIPVSTLVPSAPVNLASDISSKADAIVLNNTIYLAYNTATPAIKIFTLSSTLVQSSLTTVSENGSLNITVGADTVLNQIWVGYCSSTYVVKYFVLSSALANILSPTIIDTVDATLNNMTIVAYNGSGRIYYDLSVTYSVPAQVVWYIKSATILNTTNTPSPAILIRDVGVYSKAFYFNGDFYITVQHDSFEQSTYFVINTQASVVAKLVPRLGGNFQAGFVTAINSINGNSFNLCVIERDLIFSENGVNKYDTGVSEEIITFGQPMLTQLIGNNLHLSGGILSMYDGTNVVEHNFHLYPENIGYQVIPLGGTLADTTSGQYQYKVTYDWTDNQGQIHQSAPSIAKTVKTNGTVYFVTSTNGTQTLSNPIYNNYNVMVGMALSGPNIPAGAYITDYTNTSVTMNTNATGSATQVTVNAVPQVVKTMTSGSSPNILQMDFSLANGQYFYVIGTCLAGQTTMTVADASQLKPGYTLNYKNAPANYYVIQSVNGNVITVNNPFTFTATNKYIDVSCFLGTSGTTGNSYFFYSGYGSLTWPNLPADISVGDTFYSPNFTPNYVYVTSVTPVTGPTGYRIGISGVTNGTSGNIFKIFTADYYMKVGNVISGPGIAGQANITGVLSFGIGQSTTLIQVDQNVSQAAVSGTFFVTNLYSVTLEIPTLRVTDKVLNPVILSAWRTTLLDNIFQRVTTIENPIYNSLTVDYKTYNDTISDSVLTGDDILYTTGGVVDNFAIPAVGIMTSYRNRLMGILEESPYSFWYSKQVIPGTPVAFNDTFVVNVDQKGGQITGLATMDDKLIIFKQNLIFYEVGDGPTTTGINNDFTQPQLISSDSGCINKKSIVITPIGTMYQSAKGIYLLDRSLEVKYIGADVEAYNGITITSAQLISNFNQVRFTLITGVTLMYDYYFNQWSVFTNYVAQDASVVNSTYYMLTSTGVVNSETNGQYLDNGSYIPLKVVTNWLSMAGLQGYERMYKMLVLGHYKSPHNLNFNTYFDFNETAFQTTQIPVQTDPGVYQYRIFLSRQKCETIKFSLQDSALSPVGEGFQLSAIAFEVGIKQGLNKMAASVSYG